MLDDWLITALTKLWWMFFISPLTSYACDRLFNSFPNSSRSINIGLSFGFSAFGIILLSPILIDNPITGSIALVVFGGVVYISQGSQH